MATAITACEITDGSTVGHPFVTLRVAATEAEQITFSNDAGGTWSAWVTYAGQFYEWTLTPGDGQRTVTVKAKKNASEDTDSASCTVNSWPMTLAVLNNLSAVYARGSAGQLYGLISACAVWLAHFAASVQQLRSQLNPVAARGYWLSLWGRLFGVTRKATESDATYAQRLVPHVTGAKNTFLALQQGVRAECSGTVVVTELETYPGFVLVDLSNAGTYDLGRVQKSIYRIKPAGVKVVVKI